MTSIIRATTHPTDPELLLIYTPPDLNDRIRMLEPARWSPPDRAYLLHRDGWPALRRFASYVGAHINDQRRTSVTHTTAPQECRHCGQPGRANHPPNYCPDCGQDWNPVSPPAGSGAEGLIRVECTGCGHRQSGRFGHCAGCGHPMPTRAAITAPAVAVPRERLPEPLPLRVTVEELALTPQETR